MSAIVEENVGVARGEIHRTNTRSRAAEMMSGRIAGRIGFRFHDASAEAAGGEIVYDDPPNKESSEADSIRGKFGAAQAADSEIHRRGFRSRAR